MARRFAKVSEKEIVAIYEAAFFYPSDLVNTKTSMKSGGYIPRRFSSRYISPTIYSPPLRGIVVCYLKPSKPQPKPMIQ